jgi:hypothetical protein
MQRAHPNGDHGSTQSDQQSGRNPYIDAMRGDLPPEIVELEMAMNPYVRMTGLSHPGVVNGPEPDDLPPELVELYPDWASDAPRSTSLFRIMCGAMLVILLAGLLSGVLLHWPV